MVWKLLRKNISFGQIVGYSLASFVGLAIVLCAVKFYGDVRSAFDDKDSFISKDYIIISKKVTAANTLGLGAGTTFSPAEINDIKNQPWVRDVGQFDAADFNVSAALDFNGRGMSTHLFFEAIPDRFFDFASDNWKFTPPAAPDQITDAQIADIEIPVVMSRDYLTLYNFGFAAARGLPQLNEAIVSNVPLTFTLSGNGHRDRYRGRIVGFSSRLNTIAVPGDFIRWANARYAPDSNEQPSRLIIEANTPGDPAIDRFMNARAYEVAGDKADNSRATFFLNIVTGIVISVGAVITILAFFILMLSIFLLLQKNRRKLHNLMLLGYSPAQVAAGYYRLVILINLSVLILASFVMILVSRYWVERFAAIGIQSTTPMPAILTGLAITSVVTAINCLAIRRIVRNNF